MDAARADVELERYLAELERAPLVEDPALKRVVKRLVPGSIRPTIALIATDAIRPIAGRRASRLTRERQPVLVQLGSGRTPKPGWINVDVVGKGADVAWNLRRRLPFHDGTVDAVFHEHLLEHLTLAQGYALTQDVFRVLRPGGIVRIAVPDAERYVRSYTSAGDQRERLCPNRPTAMLAVQEVFLRHGHRAAYDGETLRFVFTAAGFEGARERGFGETELPHAPDSDHRRDESIYVEAKKPGVSAGRWTLTSAQSEVRAG